MRLEELLKKGELSNSEVSEMLYLIKTERQDDENKIKLYNHAIAQASKFGIELLYKIYKDIETYGLDEEEKKLLQGNVTFYISKQDNMTPENVQQMLYFVRTERQNDDERIKLYNHAIHQASKFGIELLYKIYKDIETYGLDEEEKKLLQGNVTFYISKQDNMTPENVQQMLYFIRTERQNDEKKIELYNHAIHQASKLGVEILHKIFNDIETYNLTEEEKKLLQGNVTFYISEQEKNNVEQNKRHR